MHQTRRRIVELLRVHGGLTVGDLARHLDLTRTAVVSHLAALQAEGYVTRAGLQPGRRRPRVVYTLTPAADGLFTKSYEEFAAALLGELRSVAPDGLTEALRRIGDRWIARDLPRVEGATGVQRVERALQVLAERGFLPQMQRRNGEYVLREHNCPLMRLAVQDAEVCAMVHRWLEALFGTCLERTRCMRLGDPYSEYRLAAPPGAAGR
ncbi:MAG: ArsR family transcriptional regulator [Armatimonadota bacterium]|nr:ArsR family transcriptional regulator [Armatimonadota bacterium]MDR7401978.1 ArsR family transcriptional regulator [Armatimonadota bacterium]MDR7403940.1 ArsR family transcriptional regulator [Armatimonadota bacterium]MDR7437250.1 ArsR family transcriptional regulator [Armatimonadota bacterium]MDR7471471.1 ArsR family transcriptional regulator [Armatimonadota bacterium]